MFRQLGAAHLHELAPSLRVHSYVYEWVTKLLSRYRDGLNNPKFD